MKKVLVFTKKGCGPCEGLKMDLASITTTIQIQIIESEFSSYICQIHKVTGFPTTIMFEDDVEIKRLLGYVKPKEKLEEFLNYERLET
jgi:thioredoxin-related protein